MSWKGNSHYAVGLCLSNSKLRTGVKRLVCVLQKKVHTMQSVFTGNLLVVGISILPHSSIMLELIPLRTSKADYPFTGRNSS